MGKILCERDAISKNLFTKHFTLFAKGFQSCLICNNYNTVRPILIPAVALLILKTILIMCMWTPLKQCQVKERNAVGQLLICWIGPRRRFFQQPNKCKCCCQSNYMKSFKDWE